MCRCLTWVTVCWAFAFLAAPVASAKALGIKALRTQQIGSTTYFYVRLGMPDGLDLPFKILSDPDKGEYLPPTACAYLWARLPRLVACDGKKWDISYRLPQPSLDQHPPRLEGVELSRQPHVQFGARLPRYDPLGLKPVRRGEPGRESATVPGPGGQERVGLEGVQPVRQGLVDRRRQPHRGVEGRARGAELARVQGV